MSKLLKRKKYFTIDDAVNHLSDALSEPVSLSDFYRLILDGHLTLSIRFQKPTYAALGKLIEPEDAESEVLKLPFDLITKSILHEPKTLSLDAYHEYPDNTNMAITKDVYSIGGIWDLKMVGSGISAIEQLYEASMGMSAVNDTKESIYVAEGALLGELKYRVAPSKEDTQLVFEYKQSLASDCRRILDDRGISMDVFTEFLGRDLESAQQDFVEFIEISSIGDGKSLTDFEITKLYEWCFGNPMPMPSSTFQASSKLEEHRHQLVIRTKEMSRFISALEDESEQEHLLDKPLSTRERESYLTLLAALCHAQDIDPKTRGVATAIVQMVDDVRLSISENTVRKILNEVSEIN